MTDSDLQIGFKVNFDRKRLKQLIGFSAPERHPIGRKQRRKNNRWRARMWHMEKSSRRNPLVCLTPVTDKDTGLTSLHSTMADGSIYSNLMFGVAIDQRPISFLSLS